MSRTRRRAAHRVAETSRSVSRAALVVAMAAGACAEEELPPVGQVLVHLDTDAPVRPQASASDPVPLFDRVLVEIYPPGEAAPCPDCRRELVVDAEKMRAGTHSFGFVPRPRVLGYRVRLVLFRSAGGIAPRPESSVELVAYLPAVAEEGKTEIVATFRTDDVGAARGTLEAPIIFDKRADPPAPSAEGTWPGAAVVECAGAPPPSAVCVPGGAFFMGDPRVTADRSGIGGRREHLVVLRPFFLDAHEVTVGELRAAGIAAKDSRGRALDPRDDADDAIAGKCDYTSDPGPNEDRPVVCVSHQLATAFCKARGGDLPTEAQLEMVASLRGTSLAPWGAREPACDEAVVGRAVDRDAGGCVDVDPFSVDRRVVPERAGQGALDRVDLPGGVALDLGANVSEWTSDAFQLDDGPCWTAPLLRDPRCDEPGATARSVKGGNLVDLPVAFAQVRRRESADDEGFQHADVGFRCAYPTEPR